MSDSRYHELVKAAEECAGLMSIGIDPNAALTKVAEDHVLNDREVTLVSHAVNNSKQLAHLQETDGEDREGVFPVTNADEVIAERHRSGTLDKNTKARTEQPEAHEIGGRIDKTAAAQSRYDDGYYRQEESDSLSLLKTAWDLNPVDRPRAEKELPMAVLGAYKHAIDEGRAKYAAAREQAHTLLDQVMAAFRQPGCPKFASVETAARRLGVEQDLLDLAYTLGRLEHFGETRGEVKTAGVTYLDPATGALVQKILDVQNFLKEAAAADAAVQVLQDRRHAVSVKLSKTAEESSDGGSKKKKKDDEGKYPFSAKVELKPFDMGQAEQTVSAMGLGADPVQTATTIFDQQAPEPAGVAQIEQEVSQDMQNIDTRARLQSVMSDKYISGADLPDIIDAYNQAMSVNPRFGEAELVAYMRQALATNNAMPLDLLVRASKSHTSGVGESA